MKIFYISNGYPDTDRYNPSTGLITNINSNSGNLIFQYVIYSLLNNRKNIIEASQINVGSKMFRTRMDYVNRNFDVIVIALANAVRASYNTKFLEYAVNTAKIPIVIVSVGISDRSILYGGSEESPALDAKFKKIFEKVCANGGMVNCRGLMSGEYLDHLGLVEHRDYEVCGCPSMYLYGPHCPIDNSVLRPWDEIEGKGIACTVKQHLNYKDKDVNDTYWEFMSANAVPGQTNIYQRRSEVLDPKVDGVMYGNAARWIDALKHKSFTYGTRIHGNIASILAGTPQMLITTDDRVKEIAEFFRIPDIPVEELEGQTLESLYSQIDYSDMNDEYLTNWDKFKSFLSKNRLSTVYDDPKYDKFVVNTSKSPNNVIKVKAAK